MNVLFLLGVFVKVKKCEWARGRRTCHTALMLPLAVKVQLWYTTLGSLLWYCLFDVLNVIKAF